ncbi:hypothetical protein LEMLEM_LOCUS22616 [Lemmus lemmus]
MYQLNLLGDLIVDFKALASHSPAWVFAHTSLPTPDLFTSWATAGASGSTGEASGDRPQEPPYVTQGDLLSTWPNLFALGLFLPTARGPGCRSQLTLPGHLVRHPWAVVQLRPGHTRQQTACSSRLPRRPRCLRSHGRWKFQRVRLPAGGGGAAME